MNYLTASARERNRRWPFLRISRNFTWDDQLPKGWRIAFGEMMWDEIANALNDETITIQDIKEKFGELRVAFMGGGNSFEKIDKIIYKYTVLSRHICIECGKPDVGYTVKGWIEPLCEDCYKKPLKDKGCSEETMDKYYQEEISDNKKMADMARWTSYANGKEVEHALWIKDTADRIRRSCQ